MRSESGGAKTNAASSRANKKCCKSVRKYKKCWVQTFFISSATELKNGWDIFIQSIIATDSGVFEHELEAKALGVKVEAIVFKILDFDT